jgi:hypothetical protein
MIFVPSEKSRQKVIDFGCAVTTVTYFRVIFLFHAFWQHLRLRHLDLSILCVLVIYIDLLFDTAGCSPNFCALQSCRITGVVRTNASSSLIFSVESTSIFSSIAGANNFETTFAFRRMHKLLNLGDSNLVGRCFLEIFSKMI